MKKIYTSIILILLGLTIYLSYTITLKNNYQDFIHLIANKFTKEKYNYNIDLVSIYITKIKSNKHFLSKK